MRNAHPVRPAISRSRGRGLGETLVVLALMSWFTAIGVPVAGESLRRARLRGAAREMGMLFRRARSEAALQCRNVGVVFFAAEWYHYSLHLDGNGNGIRMQEARRGIDPRVAGPFSMSERFPGVEVRIAPPPPIPEVPPDTGKLDDLDDPVKFVPSDIVSFSPAGSSSPGTLYLSMGVSRMSAVRVLGATGRVKFWEYDARGRRWEER